MKADILIVDDEDDIRALIQGILEDEGYNIRQAANSEQAYQKIAEQPPNLIIQDIWLQNSDNDGVEILKVVKEEYPFMPVIMISGHGTIETAVNAIKVGAYDFIEKPFKSDRLILMIERALENAQLKKENASLRQKAEGASDLVGESQTMNNLRQTIERVASTNSRVLLTGKPGTGKDLVARMIHRISERSAASFTAVNCAILRPERLEIELFGLEQGVMGEPAQEGMLEKANGGTLLLDEVADMPLETQGKIVRVLQEQQFQRVGGQDLINVDVRIIASTNRDLATLIEKGDFREDLYYRLNVVPIKLPTLHKRNEDIGALVQYFSDSFSKKNGIPVCEFSKEALVILESYDWPGNVRQLRNIVESVMIMNGGNEDEAAAITGDMLPAEIHGNDKASASAGAKPPNPVSDLMAVSLREAREMFERDYLCAQVKRFKGNISKTAQFIGMERSALHRKLKQLGISDISKHNDDERQIA